MYLYHKPKQKQTIIRVVTKSIITPTSSCYYLFLMLDLAL